MLLVWFGVGVVLCKMIEVGDEIMFKEMSKEWFFFLICIGMFEMVFFKVDLWLVEYYD